MDDRNYLFKTKSCPFYSFFHFFSVKAPKLFKQSMLVLHLKQEPNKEPVIAQLTDGFNDVHGLMVEQGAHWLALQIGVFGESAWHWVDAKHCTHEPLLEPAKVVQYFNACE